MLDNNKGTLLMRIKVLAKVLYSDHSDNPAAITTTTADITTTNTTTFTVTFTA